MLEILRCKENWLFEYLISKFIVKKNTRWCPKLMLKISYPNFDIFRCNFLYFTQQSISKSCKNKVRYKSLNLCKEKAKWGNYSSPFKLFLPLNSVDPPERTIFEYRTLLRSKSDFWIANASTYNIERKVAMHLIQ